MTWLLRHRVRQYLQDSIWLLPALAMVLALVAVRFLHRLEESMGWGTSLDPDSARAVLGMLAASMFTFIVFVSSALLIAVQLASAQLSPRIIAMLFRDPVTRISLTVFVFTFTVTLAVLVRVATSVPVLTAHLAAYSSLASLGVFLYLIDHVGKWLRPSGALRAVGQQGREVIESVYPRLLTRALEEPALADQPSQDGEPTAVIVNSRDGVILAFDINGLVVLARRADCVIEVVPQVGDFVAAGDPLFRVFPSPCPLPPNTGGAGRVKGGANLAARALCPLVAVGQERTLEQDPTFALRIIVDIASKGLSPAINDPTTAVLAIDQIHHLLRNVGNRRLDDERVRDSSGRLRLMYRTPDWEDFVHLAVTEIRHFGGESIQVARRLRAMLENLIQTLPEERAELLRQELILLRRSAERFFLEPEDRALAEVSDFQGVGGTPGQSQVRREAQPAPGRLNPFGQSTEQ